MSLRCHRLTCTSTTPGAPLATPPCEQSLAGRPLMCLSSCRIMDSRSSAQHRRSAPIHHTRFALLPSVCDLVQRCWSRATPLKESAKRDVGTGSVDRYDACGMAGGSPQWVPTGLSFRNTSHATQGDRGTQVLPRTPTGVVWSRGTEVEATWSLRANHGGGALILLPSLNMCDLSTGWVESHF